MIEQFYCYNVNGQTTSLKLYDTEDYFSGAGTPRYDISFEYDRRGNITKRTDSSGLLSETYEYDNRGRLIKSSSASSVLKNHEWTYDDFNNIVSWLKDTERNSYVYEDGGHKLSYVSGLSDTTTYTYNENGDVIEVKKNEKVEKQFVYDSQNRVSSANYFITDETGTKKFTAFSYAYDSTGERVVKNKLVPGTDGTVVYTTVYWFGNYEEEFVNSKLSARVKLYSANEGVFAQRTVTLDKNENVTGDTLSYMFKDQLGSTLMTFGTDGKLTGRYAYEPFGKMIYREEAASNGIRRTFTGHMLEDDEGLYYCHARWYDATVGRFLQADSVLDGFNRYSYCGNNPVNFSDPSGMKKTAEQKAAEKAAKKAEKQAKKDAKAAEKQAKKEAKKTGSGTGNKNPEVVGHLLRDPDSYKTVDGQNKDLRGKDLLIVENKSNGESVSIPVSSVANMEGYGLSDSLAEKEFTLSYDPDCGSKYAPDVFTISSGELCSDNALQQQGEKLHSDGTTDTNKVPWRGHNTNFWGSQGCITGQTGNANGDYTDVSKALNSWGITGRYDIPCSFGLGVY